MKILVVGNGGREHALCWKLSGCPSVKEVLCAPGNGGIEDCARCIPVASTDIDAQLNLALCEAVDLVIIGPEAPLVAGLADRLEAAGIPVFGPSSGAAQLEGSKTFSKDFMKRHSIPTAAYSSHTRLDDALAEIQRRNGPCVVKADGLAAGKGVILCNTADEASSAVKSILKDGTFGEAGARVVIEDYLSGEEASVLAICDGTRFLPLIAAQDHKAAYEGDTGPNTGGMGAYAPTKLVTPDRMDQISREVLAPTVVGMAKDGHPFKGILYAGLMIDGDRIQVLEFNVRFGDPECQPLLALLDSDLAEVLLAAATGRLEGHTLAFREGAALCVVLASGGYPGPIETGRPITGLTEAATLPDVMVFHAGTARSGDQIVTSGGRVLGVTGMGNTLHEASQNAYAACDRIHFDAMRMRRDIGHRAIEKR